MAQHSDLGAANPLSAEEERLIDAWWRAANYLSVGQIYLLDNPLLDEPLERAHIKPRLLGHWGTTPGLNFIYAHLNRVIACKMARKLAQNPVAAADLVIELSADFACLAAGP
jgi:phosphoketolase